MNNRNFSDNIEGTLLVEAFASQNFLRELGAYYLLDRKKYEEIERPFRVFNVLTEEEQEERTKQKTERYYEERPNKTLEEYLRDEVGKVNEEYSYMPIPQTASECSQRLKQVTGVMYFEFLKWKFKNKYGTNPPLKAVQEEIKAIEEFINEAEIQPISKAYSDPKTWEIDKIKQAYYEYLRVENGYYEHKKVDYTYGNMPCIVFSFCRLFLPYLLKVKNEIENTTPISMKSLSKSMTLYANDWDYYFNVGNSSDDIVNGFIIPTKEYFETGERAGFMDSLQFMNLLWEQIDFLESNRKKPYSTLKHYESLPITEEQRHVLFGFILKFYNGYPVIEINSRKGDGICLLLIEEAFLRYTGDTPEKKYCHNSKVIHDNTNSEYIILEELPQTYIYNAKDFEEISTKYDWDFYHNVDNIANQKGLVLPVRKYFQVGSRGGFIEPLAFLNLMWQQCIYIRTNESKPHSVITNLKLLPINDKVRHILYGMLLKFEVGGYPVAGSSNTPNHNLIMKLIEKEFLNYPEATPEKEFCKQIEYVFELYEGNTPEKWFCLREDEQEKKINEGVAILEAKIEKEETDVIVMPNIEDNDRCIIEKHLNPLNGYWNREKIMSDKEFFRLFEYVCFMVKNKEMPKNIEPIKQTKISTEFLRKTFQLLHFDLYGKRKKDYWIDFLHITFVQFQNWDKSTTKAHFTTYRSNYEKDKEKISC